MLSPAELHQAGAGIILGNTYHLSQRPGGDTIETGGGLACFMGWNGPTLTDSGGYQVFSLSDTRKISEEGVSFRSIYDGKPILFTPESVLMLQRQFGADIIYALDVCSPLPSSHEEVDRATSLTTRWAKRFLSESKRTCDDSDAYQALFLVVQGGMYIDLRKRSVEELAELDPPGFGIGGLSVGESQDEMLRIASLTCELLPEDKPRHLLGVGTPSDILAAIGAGVDMFDCVLPTRNGRNGSAFTSHGIVNIRNSRYKNSTDPLDSHCECYGCKTFTQSYLHHLVTSSELLGLHMLTLHNITYYLKLVSDARKAIKRGLFLAWKSEVEAGWQVR